MQINYFCCCLKLIPGNIILSRTDSIGDAVLCFPVAKVLKDHFPGIKIAYLGREYTRQVTEACAYIDQFIEYQEFLQNAVQIAGEPPQCIVHVLPERPIAARAKELGIPVRIGTTNRLFHWRTCNRLVRLSRRHSRLHEIQLNLRLLEPLGISQRYPLEKIGQWYGLHPPVALPGQVASLVQNDKYNLILHPRSRGSAREWALRNFVRLIHALDPAVYRIFISGTRDEQKSLHPLFEEAGDRVVDLTGRLTVKELISFIAQCDGLVACSTGPLHMAAALGKDALGLYAPLHKIRPERWGPVGPKARVFGVNRVCTDCFEMRAPCHCIEEINYQEVKEELDKRAAAKSSLSEIVFR